jgi:4'-phosphopantetheinyl transferase
MPGWHLPVGPGDRGGDVSAPWRRRHGPEESVPPPGTHCVPPPGTAQIWCHLLPPSGLTPQDRSRLDATVDIPTRTRLARYRRAADRDRGLLAHSLLRRLAVASLGGDPAQVRIARRCATCGSPEHGKPYLAGAGAMPEINLTHSGRVVAVALAAPGTAIGLDVEHVHAVDWEAVAPEAFNAQDQGQIANSTDPHATSFTIWTRKEAAAKATGDGLSHPFGELMLRDVGGGHWTGATRDGVTVTGRDLDTEPSHMGAVAVVGLAAGQKLELDVHHVAW